MGAHGKIFISYRREDAPGDARGICDRLGRSFGAANVFMDVDKLLAGQRFERELDKALARCDALIAVIGSRWTELLTDCARSGRRDYVREEIAAALKRDIVVIPVMIGREANMPPLPPADQLPENIRDLVLYQKHNIAHETFRRDAADLVAALKTVLRDRRGPRPWRAIAAATVGVVGLVLAVALLGDWVNVMGRMRPGIPQPSVSSNEFPKAAIFSSDVPSKKDEEEASRRAEAEAIKKAADDEAARKVADETKPLAEADAAKRKADEEAEQANLVVADCDRLAASPYDADRPSEVAGVLDYTRIEGAATAACDQAMRRYPEVARFTYQAGRAALAGKDYAKAERLFRSAIAKGSVGALGALGVMYANGIGIAQDSIEARKLYEQGVARGNSNAMNNLGHLYENGRGVPQDYAEARRWYEKGATLGNAIAMTSLGNLYANGRGVTRDYAAARKWYEQAAVIGYATAVVDIGWLYEGGKGVTQDYAEARMRRGWRLVAQAL